MKIYIPSSMFKLALKEPKAYNMSGKCYEAIVRAQEAIEKAVN